MTPAGSLILGGMVAGAAFGFVAGKLDLDKVVAEIMQNRRVALAAEQANVFLHVQEQRNANAQLPFQKAENAST